MAVHDRLTDVPGLAPGPGYAHAVTATGPLAFVAGQVALDADGGLVGTGDVAAQAARSLGNLQHVLEALGADWGDVVRLTWYVLDAADVQVVRDARDAVPVPALGGRPNPASTLVQVAALLRPDLLIEVDAVVALPL